MAQYPLLNLVMLESSGDSIGLLAVIRYLNH